MRNARVLALVVCVALAGCSGVPGLGDESTPTGDVTPSPTGTPTATPTETPTATPTPAPGEVLADAELPPGLTTERIDDPAALVETHRENLAETGAVTSLEVAVETDGYARESTTEARIGSDGTVEVSTTTESGVNRITSETYADGPKVYLNRTNGGDTTYSVLTSEHYRSQSLPSAALEPYLTIANFSVSSVDAGDDATLVTLTATGANESVFADADATLGNVSGQVVVDLSGTIHQLSLQYELTTDLGTNAYDVAYEVQRRGVDTVEKPAWTETAVERSVTANLSYELEGDVLSVSHEGGDTLPSDLRILVTPSQGSDFQGTDVGSQGTFVAILQADFQAGETAYVNRSEAGDGTGAVTIGERPDAGGSLADGLVVIIFDGHTGEVIDVAEVEDE